MKAFKLLTIILFLFTWSVRGQKIDSLQNLFQNPSVSLRPYVWWHWMGPNFSKEGITKDLEAMKEIGVGGATIFNLTSAVQESHFPTKNNPWPDQTYRSASYWEAIKHATSEAHRLGLELGIHNTVGYSTTGGPWIDEKRSMQHLVWSDTTIIGDNKYTNFLIAKPKLVIEKGWGSTGRKFSYYKDIAILAIPSGKKEIGVGEIIDLTSKYDSLNGLHWFPPKGEKWIVFRFGHASTGRSPHPVPDDVLGLTLEVDKMSAEHNLYHWNTVLQPFKEHIGNYLGKTFKHMLIDSYEAGNQNWTPNFRDEFIKRKGYDPLPWIVSMGQPITGKKEPNKVLINSTSSTQRFEWDYNDVINQLFFDNGFAIGKQKLGEMGLDLLFEPYGGQFNTAQGVALSTIPMGEFWTNSSGAINSLIPASARAAGHRIVGAEAFTGRPEISKYTEDPEMLKKSADGAFASGVNRLFLHHWVHQPFKDIYQPGMGMGWWGTHFGRYQTWFEPGKTFFKYLARCQALLQYGEEKSDYLCFEKNAGFSDVISKTDFLRNPIKVENGQIVLPSGRMYPFMVFPGNGEMLPEVAEKIKEMVAKGATIVSVKPVRSPSLSNFPECDILLKKIADEVWGDSSFSVYKKGQVFTSIDKAKEKFLITPDYQIENAPDPKNIKVAHRYGNHVDVYFIVNQSHKAQNITISFRINGMLPELWQAEDGSVCNAPVWNEKNGRTNVSIQMQSMQSVFVVFRVKALKNNKPSKISINDTTANWIVRSDEHNRVLLSATSSVSASVDYSSGETKVFQLPGGKNILLNGEWRVQFSPKLDKPFELKFDSLLDFSNHPSKNVMYFSGTATYFKTFTFKLPSPKERKRIELNLGQLNDIAEVKVNGNKAGVLWYPPYKTDITGLLRDGRNTLEIAVTNNWANRLIGDEQEPADFEWGNDRGEKLGRAMNAYPKWFINNQPRPSKGRKTFNVWYYYRSNSKLNPAGLLGPVQLITISEVEL